MDDVRATRLDPIAPRPSASRALALLELRRVDPGSPIPGPWIRDEEIGERILRLGRRECRRLLCLFVSLLRPAVERAVREVLDREAILLDVREVAVRVFDLLSRQERASRADPVAGSLEGRLRDLALQAVRQGLHPDPLEPPLFEGDGRQDPVVARAAQAAFNRLPRAERVALRSAAAGNRSASELAAALGTSGEAARRTVARARRRFAAEQRRVLADAARRRPRDPDGVIGCGSHPAARGGAEPR